MSLLEEAISRRPLAEVILRGHKRCDMTKGVRNDKEQ